MNYLDYLFSKAVFLITPPNPTSQDLLLNPLFPAPQWDGHLERTPHDWIDIGGSSIDLLWRNNNKGGQRDVGSRERAGMGRSRLYGGRNKGRSHILSLPKPTNTSVDIKPTPPPTSLSWSSRGQEQRHTSNF